MRLSSRQSHWILAFSLLLYSLFTAWYSVWLPPFEYADGPRHLAFMQWLADGKGLPPQGRAAWETPIQQEAGQPPLYHLIGALPIAVFERYRPGEMSAQPLIFRENPTYFGPSPHFLPDNDNIALHYLDDGRPLGGEYAALYLARGVTWLFGLLLLVSMYGLTRTLLPQHRWAALQVVWLTALTPQILYISGVASNDIPVAALCTLTVWQLALLLREGPGLRRAAAVGLALGAAVLTKISALALAPGVGLGLVWLWWYRPNERKRTLIAGAVIGGLASAIAGWWFVRAWRLYGAPLGLDTHDYAPWAYNAGNPRTHTVWEMWRNVFESLWVSIGWGPIEFPDWVYAGLGLLVALAVFGCARRLVQWRRDGTLRARWRRDPQLIMGAILLLVLLLTAAALQLWMMRVAAEFGRLLFPAIAAIMLPLITGWRALHRRLVLLPLVALLLLAILTPLLLLRPAYQPRPLSPARVAALPPAVGWRFGEFAELISADVLVETGIADSVLPVDVCWRALQPSAVDYVILLHIVGEDNWVAANRYTVPGLGAYPTATWRAGDVLCDTITIRTWGNIEAPRVFDVEIGFITPDLTERVPAVDSVGRPLPHTFIDQVRIAPAEMPLAAPLPDPAAAIVLVGASVPPTWQAGEPVSVTLEWQVADPVDRDYQLFLHLRDATSGELIAQADGPPVGGRYGTSWWQQNERVVDERLFPLPETTPPGRYQLVTGLYDLATGEPLGPAHLAAEVEVKSR